MEEMTLDAVNEKIVKLLERRGLLIDEIKICSFGLALSDDKEEIVKKIRKIYEDIKSINVSILTYNAIQTAMMNEEMNKQLEELEALL